MDGNWRLDTIVFGSQGPFLALKDLLVAHRLFGAKVHAVKHRICKAERIRAFGVHVENGRFLVKGDAACHFDSAQMSLYDELTTLPLADGDDQADACAIGTAWLLHSRELRVF